MRIPLERAFDQPVGGLERKAVLIAFPERQGGDADRPGLGVAEHLLDRGRQLGAGRAFGNAQGMTADLARVEDVHVDVDINHVGQTAETVHLPVDLGGGAAQVIHGEEFDFGPVEKLLFERIYVAQSAHDDILRRKRRVEPDFQAKPGQTHSRRDGHVHPSQHPAQGRLRSVEVGVGVQIDQADTERFTPGQPFTLEIFAIPARDGRTEMLQPSEHPQDIHAIGQKADDKALVQTPGGDQTADRPVLESVPVPLAVFFFLGDTELDRLDSRNGKSIPADDLEQTPFGHDPRSFTRVPDDENRLGHLLPSPGHTEYDRQPKG